LLRVKSRPSSESLKAGTKTGTFFFEGGAENAAALGVFNKEFADALVKLPTADDFVGIPFFEDGFDDFLDVIEISFRLEGIVDAVVAARKSWLSSILEGS